MQKTNIMYKAAKLLMEKSNIKKGLEIKIEKRIPEKAGLGGGSSDAACVLKILNEMFGLNYNKDELVKLAFELGSDVPFFIYGGICRVSGLGEKIKPISSQRMNNIIVVQPGYGLATNLVFKESDNYEVCNKSEILDKIEQSLKEGAFEYNLLFNDLEKPANELSKESGLDTIEELKEIIIQTSPKAVLMSGSGSVVYGIYEGDCTDGVLYIRKNLKSGRVYRI